ncbi:MAG: response regulator [Candidatus Brocadiae bacterium]|nr:response regulator [Candidatus Brocadiia bacterium]
MSLNIVCIDDQREVLATLKKDMSVFRSFFKISYCESSQEAKELLEEIDAKGDHIALLVCDHIMPGQSGIDFLIQTNQDRRFQSVKKILLTGLANHQDTIKAINQAAIQQYIEKPWNSENLTKIAKILLTEYILETGQEYQEYMPILDQPTLYQKLRK